MKKVVLLCAHERRLVGKFNLRIAKFLIEAEYRAMKTILSCH